MKAFGIGALLLGAVLDLVSGFVFFAAITDFRLRDCPDAAQCSDAVSVMVLTGCAVVAALVMIFAGLVFVRR